MIRKIIRVDKVDSTNELAKRIARYGAADGTVILAEEQTGGKGRLDRKFFSPRDKGLWFSIILQPKCSPNDAPKFTLMAAAAIACAMKRFNLHAEIKWPNDIMYDGRKLVGILTEINTAVDRVNFIVVGIGINVNVARSEFPEELREVAASLSEMNGGNLNREKFFSAVLEEFDRLYIQNDFGEVFKIWREYNITLRKNIDVISAETGEIFSGEAIDIAEDGALIVQTESGQRIIYAGDVSIRTK